MSGRGGPRSIWKKHSKPQGEVKREEGDKLYYRINRRTGRIETNLLEWERSWRNVKVLKFPARYADELRLGVRVNPTIEQILEANVMLPDVDTTREYWVPTPEQTAELADSDRVTLKLGSGVGLMLGDLPLTASQFGLGWMLTVGCRLQDTQFNYDK